MGIPPLPPPSPTYAHKLTARAACNLFEHSPPIWPRGQTLFSGGETWTSPRRWPWWSSSCWRSGPPPPPPPRTSCGTRGQRRSCSRCGRKKPANVNTEKVPHGLDIFCCRAHPRASTLSRPPPPPRQPQRPRRSLTATPPRGSGSRSVPGKKVYDSNFVRPWNCQNVMTTFIFFKKIRFKDIFINSQI